MINSSREEFVKRLEIAPLPTTVNNKETPVAAESTRPTTPKLLPASELKSITSSIPVTNSPLVSRTRETRPSQEVEDDGDVSSIPLTDLRLQSSIPIAKSVAASPNQLHQPPSRYPTTQNNTSNVIATSRNSFHGSPLQRVLHIAGREDNSSAYSSYGNQFAHNLSAEDKDRLRKSFLDIALFLDVIFVEVEKEKVNTIIVS
jgi:hypothetical protein